MIRKLLPSVLCIFLSPLLVAQQAAQQATSATTQPAPLAQIPSQITLSPHGTIHIVTPANVSLAKVKPGTTVRFVIDSDVTVDGVKLIPASTPVEGVVQKVIHGSRFLNRSAETFIQVRDSVPGMPANIILRCSKPDNNFDGLFGETMAQFTIVGILDTAAIILLFLLLLLLLSF